MSEDQIKKAASDQLAADSYPAFLRRLNEKHRLADGEAIFVDANKGQQVFMRRKCPFGGECKSPSCKAMCVLMGERPEK